MSLWKVSERLRPFLLIGTTAAVIIQVIVSVPRVLEDPRFISEGAQEAQSLPIDMEASLVPDLPSTRVANYAILDLNYVSIASGKRQWKIAAQRALMYNPERVVHGRTINALLFDSSERTTLVKGLEAKYILDQQKEIEIFGQVVATLPDGFEIKSDYLKYKPQSYQIYIPKKFHVQGNGQQKDGNKFQFKSFGMQYNLNTNEVTLLQKAHVFFTETLKQTDSSPGKRHEKKERLTEIKSDYCIMERNKNLAHFRMHTKTKPRHVHILQTGLFARAKLADLSYGDFSRVVDGLIASEDVLIKEIQLENPETLLRYSTSGKAVFNSKENQIMLTEYPQAYQNRDTVAGDVIILHRDSGLVEVEQSNAFSEGSTQAEKENS